MPSVSTVSRTGNVYVDGVLGDYKWATTSLTYSFPTSASFYGTGYRSGEPATNFGALNPAQVQMAKTAYAAYAAVANLTFTQITESSTTHADLRVALSDAPGTAWGYYPSTAASGGDVWLNKSSGYYNSPAKGNYAYMSFIHEIGHTLGLEHPHENNMPLSRDSIEYTVMSYRSYVGAPLANYANETWGYAQSLMMYDIAAVQQMYGANYTTNSGNSVYTWSPTTGQMSINGAGQGAPGANRILMTVWDGGGIDTYDFSNYSSNLTVDLNPGGWTTTSTEQLARLSANGSKLAIGNIANALLFNGDLRSIIENAEGGAGNDRITGNVAANTLWGNGGADTLIGGDGDDLLYGGSGGDRLEGGNGTDTVSHLEATARVVVDLATPSLNGGEATGDTYSSIEQVIGTNYNDSLWGDSAANGLGGFAGNDTLNGRGGNDVLVGGDGDDVLEGGVGADRLEGGNGNDTASYSVALLNSLLSLSISGVTADLMTPSANTGEAAGDSFFFIENLTGSAFNDVLRGDNGANILNGLGGNNTLVGRGGNDTLLGGIGNDRLQGDAGADTLTGGLGIDTFVFTATGDTPSVGRDTITDFVSLTDKIDLKAIDANTSLTGDQAFSYIGSSGFTNKAGQLNFKDGLVSGDVNGDGIADFQIVVKGLAILAAGDFIL
ncbi:MAG: serralysin [Devosia sp.]|uniref:M10 family metallopeptidase C-terminal domain-containing protein n=1 Tax=Devosia sp. TaxID=1871048 RepID=UPI002617F6C7|nr:M10 family metallopeptidase C-terminal domain-containing protein [Devosia sp.]MDB5541126.1 serralysin [Devosia sp.]